MAKPLKCPECGMEMPSEKAMAEHRAVRGH